MDHQTRVIAARWIVPIAGDPIQGGWIRLRGREVVELGRGAAPRQAVDLGDVALLPGLVNAHTHLEFSDCRDPIGQPGMPLADWIAMVIAARGGACEVDRQHAIADGIAESRAAGVRLIAEISTPPCEYPSPDESLEWIAMAEVLGLSPPRAAERLAAATRHNQIHRQAGWSPHAPYSTTLAAIDACVEQSRRQDRLLAMHVAESPAERELLVAGTGPFADSLKRLGVWQAGLFPWGPDPFLHLIERLSPAPAVLLVHGNDLRDSEIEHLAGHRQITVVYCPRTHAFFGYDRHPVGRMIEAGIRVALGTDSRASNPDLSVWNEVRFLLDHRPDLDPRAVLRMATVNGAEALGRHDLGRIAVGAQPGLGFVPTTASTLGGLYGDLAGGEFATI